MALEAAGIPYRVLNVEEGNTSRHQDFSWKHKEADAPLFDMTIIVVNPDNLAAVARRMKRTVFRDRYTIAYWFWELPEIPDDWLPAFSFVDEVWGASRFVQEALSVKSPLPTFRVPVPVKLEIEKVKGRNDWNLPEQAFLFLNTCDTHSFLARKNPLGLIDAFKRAFRADDDSVGLVLKINNPARFQSEISELREAAAGYCNIYLIDRIVNREEVAQLLALTDCFVSLHRSEGYGLGPAEAMSFGKPIILTGWSGNTDYMTPDNSFAVDYRLSKVGKDFGPYSAEQLWADPDLNHAARLMATLARAPGLAVKMGHAGRETIAKFFSPAAVGESIALRLSYIRTWLYRQKRGT